MSWNSATALNSYYLSLFDMADYAAICIKSNILPPGCSQFRKLIEIIHPCLLRLVNLNTFHSRRKWVYVGQHKGKEEAYFVCFELLIWAVFLFRIEHIKRI